VFDVFSDIDIVFDDIQNCSVWCELTHLMCLMRFDMFDMYGAFDGFDAFSEIALDEILYLMCFRCVRCVFLMCRMCFDMLEMIVAYIVCTYMYAKVNEIEEKTRKNKRRHTIGPPREQRYQRRTLSR